MFHKSPNSEKHFSLATLIMCTVIITWEIVEFFKWDGSFNGLDLLVVIAISVIGAKTYSHIFNEWI
jgi:hypothetical protein